MNRMRNFAFFPHGFPRRVILSVLVAAALSRTFAQNVSDSALYFLAKAGIPRAPSIQLVIETADALAGQGLYAEALDMLVKLAPNDERKKTTGKKNTPWRVSTGVDYYHLQDVDTIAMTPDQLRDYQRLTRTPLTAYARAAYEVDSVGELIKKVSPEMYFSSYKGGFEIPLRMEMSDGKYSLEAAVRADKWFQSTASGREPFAPDRKQASDMGGASLRFSQSAPLLGGALWALTAPVSVGWEHYRADRPGYESFVEGGITPVLELRYKQGSPLSTRLTGEARYEDYYRKMSDSLSAARFLARMENDFIYPGGLSANLTVEWQGDRYADRHVPADIDRWEGAMHSEYVISGWMAPRIYVRVVHEEERYDSADTAQAYTLPGSDLTVRPSIRFRWGKAFTVEPELNWRRRRADLFPDSSPRRLIWEAYDALEPGLRLEGSFPRVDVSGRASYRLEDVDEVFEQFIGDSRSIKISGDGSVVVIKGLSINFLVDYQYRIYKPYASRGRKTENFTLSGQVTHKW